MKSAPVSPTKMRAGGKLKGRKPSSAPTSATPIIRPASCAALPGQHGERRADDGRDAGAQAVEPVDQVEGVRHHHDPGRGEQPGQPRREVPDRAGDRVGDVLDAEARRDRDRGGGDLDARASAGPRGSSGRPARRSRAPAARPPAAPRGGPRSRAPRGPAGSRRRAPRRCRAPLPARPSAGCSAARSPCVRWGGRSRRARTTDARQAASRAPPSRRPRRTRCDPEPAHARPYRMPS